MNVLFCASEAGPVCRVRRLGRRGGQPAPRHPQAARWRAVWYCRLYGDMKPEYRG